LKNKTLVGALKFIEKEKKRNETKKAGFFLYKQPHWGHMSTFGRQRFDY
jgi:hypothetical protein